ncbi:hypothetical protein V1639_02925 [Pseudarthrobacter sp. J75]|uniref:hypothetical protein n=1 Tax=unclassified Pseudarthrobacter TaxID=2647000 RepID=UPI002E823ACA|nr:MULTISPECIES: hypothetical protein [unclassified Pseudarthrobacter]MEE2522373.1 hypothetical protein [Pseudarthrobacter sp. J47]MEE2527981.1 hypothetical protein [Pseudarthrobacter sp. J75]
MRTGSGYWLTLSCLLALVVLTVGFAPVPLVFILGGLLILGFVATRLLYGRFQDAAISEDSRFAAFPVLASVAAFNLALLLRGSAWAGALVPVLALALFVACLVWSRKRLPARNQGPLRADP